MRDKELENVIYLVNRFEPYSWDDEKLQGQAIDFLK